MTDKHVSSRCLYLHTPPNVCVGHTSHGNMKVLGSHYSWQVKRLDRAEIIAHCRKVGATGTFLATSCDKVLPTGQRATHLYVFPKYSLVLAQERQADLRVLVDMSLPEEPESVWKACVAPETQTYDFQRHIRLRQTYVCVFGATDGGFVDTHREYVQGGGHTEHCLFVAGLFESCSGDGAC